MSTNLATHFSSARGDWATPPALFEKWNRRYHFTLDVCARADNAKVARYITPEQDTLSQSWAGEVCWMNPPYGDPEHPCKPACHKKRCKERGWHTDRYIPGIMDFMRKAYRESLQGATVVCLVPARTDTRWFHRYVKKKARTHFIKGRVYFVGAEHGAPFPSMIVIYTPPGQGARRTYWVARRARPEPDPGARGAKQLCSVS